MHCIICGEEKAESDEHIVPEALGNKKLITKRVCEHCNNQLGANVDYYLTDHPIVKIIRMEGDLTGKKGKDIKLFNGIEIDVNNGAMYSMKNNKPSLQPRLVQIGNNGQCSIEAKSLEEGISFFRKYMKRQGYSDHRIDEVCKRAVCHEVELTVPEFKIDATIDFAKLDFAAIKIAYEYAFEKLGETYLDDAIAKEFARELFKAVQAEKNNVTVSDSLAKYVMFPIIGSGLENILAEEKEKLSQSKLDILHMLFIIQQKNSLYCVLHLFMTDIITFVVKVTDCADLYNRMLPFTFVLKDGQVLEF